MRIFQNFPGLYFLSNHLSRYFLNNSQKISSQLYFKQASNRSLLSRLVGSRCFHLNSPISAKNVALKNSSLPEFQVKKLEIISNRRLIEITWKDDHISRFHSSWLRFNCFCPECKRNITGESNIDRTTFVDDLYITDVKVSKDKDDSEQIELKLNVEEDHVVILPLKFLREMCYSEKSLSKMISSRRMTFWDPTKSPLPTLQYKDTLSDEGRFKWFETMIEVGFSIVKNVPRIEGKVIEIAEQISPLVYGTYEKMFDVYDFGSTANLAYSSVALPLHMDVVHLESAPGIQLLHAIEYDDCVDGGNSILVDMFEAARLLRERFPKDFEVLTRVPVTFSITDYKKKDPIFVLHRKPIISVDYDGEIVACAWNPGTEQTLRVHENDVETFYSAYKKLHSLTVNKDLQFNFRLYPGDLLLFNNRRMLHSREAYTSNGGKRRLQGTYCSMEELRNKYVILGRKLGIEVRETIIGNGSSL